jgi:hypothetical protein
LSIGRLACSPNFLSIGRLACSPNFLSIGRLACSPNFLARSEDFAGRGGLTCWT